MEISCMLQWLYIVLIIVVCLRILMDTRSPSKAAAYMLLVILLPIAGIIIYFSVGINYRKRKIYSKNLFAGELRKQINDLQKKDRDRIVQSNPELMKKYAGLADLALNHVFSPITDNNEVELLINGEEKFPSVLAAVDQARQYIHLEYYIFDPDTIGLEMIERLIRKAKEGVKVRFIFDDFGAHKVRRHMKRMREAGIEVYPFYTVKLYLLANRLNYRNHRKIIVIDGEVGFIGGINISDKYQNSTAGANDMYWRDTHLKVRGGMVRSLQYIFMVDWNFCSKQKLTPNSLFFHKEIQGGNTIGQVIASGPDSDSPYILQSIVRAISLAREEVLITNPYFIPHPTVLEVIMITALSGVRVKLLVPGVSDSWFINMGNHSYFQELLKAGVEIYTYNKGFVHAKTIVIDSEVAMVGTANMDSRSFELNFEVNAIIYDRKVAGQLRQIFYDDLKDVSKVDPEEWEKRPMYRQLMDKLIRLVAPLL
jgi:cardiolipin synthase